MKPIINYFKTSIWTIISFLLVIVLILIPLASFLSYSFFTVEGVEIIHQFSLINYKEFFIDEIYINTFVRTIFLAFNGMLRSSALALIENSNRCQAVPAKV